MISTEKEWAPGFRKPIRSHINQANQHPPAQIPSQAAHQPTTVAAPADQDSTGGIGHTLNPDTSISTTAHGHVATLNVERGILTCTKKSKFHDEPITHGPFDKSKYVKPTKKAAVVENTPNHRTRISTARPSPAGPLHKTPEPNTSIPRASAKQVEHPNPAVAPQGANFVVPSVSFEPAQTQTQTPPKAETPNSLAFHANQQPPRASQSFDISPSSVGNQLKPHTAGRPLTKQPQAHLEYNLVELPADRLRRIQQAAKIQGRINAARRGNKHDTASPEVLAYIRKQLDPHLTELVNRRIHHYWAIGNDNLPATESSDVEPSWPSELHKPDAGPDGGAKKFPQQKGSGMASSPEHANLVAANRRGNPRWASHAEIRGPPHQPDGNVWGSAVSSGGMAADSQDSVQVESGDDGSDANVGAPINLDTHLVGWDGKMQPPPVDWAARPRFDHASIDHMNHMNNWLNAGVKVTELKARELKATKSRDVIPVNEVLDITKHADGLWHVPATETINARNATYYGYDPIDYDLMDILKACIPVSEEELKGNATVKFDDSANNTVVDETTEILVQRWIAQNGWLKSPGLPEQKKAAFFAPPAHYQPTMATDNPRVRIALRPATVADLMGMTTIYNWYVEHSPRPSELDMIDESDMQRRLEEIQRDKLPLIVAVARSRWRGMQWSDGDGGRARTVRHKAHAHHHPSHQPMVQEETILGWASASDFGARDYVERTSAECEIYVAREGCQLGIGTALMDKLLEACDRGHIPSGKCDWHCAPDQQHLYTAGGGRELHKIFFSVKKFSKPIKVSKHEFASEYEHDWDAWLKKWLESWGFKQEAVLNKIGAKNGRFIDIVYMTRETMWQPQEGHIPDPLPGTY
ncbi:hypothetical protein DV737_g612, partial [Chaetothyriales sp. CBS 132003]